MPSAFHPDDVLIFTNSGDMQPSHKPASLNFCIISVRSLIVENCEGRNCNLIFYKIFMSVCSSTTIFFLGIKVSPICSISMQATYGGLVISNHPQKGGRRASFLWSHGGDGDIWLQCGSGTGSRTGSGTWQEKQQGQEQGQKQHGLQGSKAMETGAGSGKATIQVKGLAFFKTDCFPTIKTLISKTTYI